jgi:hypothetical protein
LVEVVVEPETLLLLLLLHNVTNRGRRLDGKESD